MHGDFSRRTFDAGDGYRSVLLQQGRPLLDADVNEQNEITAHHDEVRARDIIGRSGGPAPAGEEPGPFAITAPSSSAASGWGFTDEPWSALRVRGGNYYVDGVLAESLDGPANGWRLANQPHLPVIPLEDGDVPGLVEPEDDGRYLAYLDVWTRQVTFDEDPLLLESALGGPDTTTRAQTVWQVKLAPIGAGVTCSDLHEQAATLRTPRRLAAELAPPVAGADPCEISASGGYRRLENQLYRVQVHDGPDPASGTAPDGTFLWSRDNGSVRAGLDGLDVVNASTAVLVLDRQGRDEELSFGSGDLVEVTSRDRELRGQPGFLAEAGTPDELELPVTWRDGGPESLAALGSAPIVRRWEGGPEPIATTVTELEDGIGVRFPAGGTAATGDHWLIPARTVRLVHGLAQISGTIEWPPRIGQDVEQPPIGPDHHLTPLAILTRTGGLWSTESDCRLLFPALTELVTLDEIGGDGQEAMPGDPLPQPIRVTVRNGERPVPGAAVQFTASDAGTLDPASPPTSADPAEVLVPTGPDGVAQVRWRLNPAGPTTQTLTARRLDDHGSPIDVPVVVTGRIGVARQVAWDPVGCLRFARTRTVQDALETIISRRELRLLGGDGQSVTFRGEVVQRPVRVVVDDGCGPVVRAKVTATASSGFLDFGQVAPFAGEALPPAAGYAREATVETDEQGVAAFWWRPAFAGTRRWASLQIILEDSLQAPIVVNANLDASGEATPPVSGLHIERLVFATEPLSRFENDSAVGVSQLAAGIVVGLDGPVVESTVRDKPVMRVVLELPWPVGSQHRDWVPEGFDLSGTFATQAITLDAKVWAEGSTLFWNPTDSAASWLEKILFEVLGPRVQSVLGRFELDGWAVVAESDPALHLNGHAKAVVESGVEPGLARTLLDLPTDDAVAGGQFVQWFHLRRSAERVLMPEVPDVSGRTVAVAERILTGLGFTVTTRVEPSEVLRKGLVIETIPRAGTTHLPGSAIEVVVSGGRGG